MILHLVSTMFLTRSCEPSLRKPLMFFLSLVLSYVSRVFLPVFVDRASRSAAHSLTSRLTVGFPAFLFFDGAADPVSPSRSNPCPVFYVLPLSPYLFSLIPTRPRICDSTAFTARCQDDKSSGRELLPSIPLDLIHRLTFYPFSCRPLLTRKAIPIHQPR